MATPGYEGGIGGKFRKRPFRRVPTKPYDRPPSAARGGLRARSSDVGSGGWISKLAGDASRLIAVGASRIFASFFHKRLAASPVAPSAPATLEENHQLRQEVPEVACINTSSEPQDQQGNDGHEPTKYSSTNNSDVDEISELEQVVMQKTFTRVEFDHLMELLRSRTVEPVILEPAVDNGKGENENASGQENGVVKCRSHENFSSPAVSLTIPKDESASPVELAKTFMGCMPSEVSPSTLTLRKQVFQEDTTLPNVVPYVKPLNLPAAPRSAIRFSGIAELPENGYQTPKPRGRSAICRMSCSPYFKVHPTTNIKGGRPSGNGHTGPSLSQMTPRNLLVSGGRQILKRRSSVLDSDSGSFGPIRRIRQKSYLMSPSKGIHSTPLNKDVMEGSSSGHRPSQLDEHKYNSTRLQDAHDEEKKISYKKVIPIPPKSTETAMKILQQLDKLVPSPKEKSSEPKVIAREESPYLTHNVLGGRAPRSTEDLYSLKSFNVQGRGSLDTNSDSRLSPTNSLERKLYSIQENGPLKSTVLADKLTSEACSTVNAAIPSTDANPGTRILDFPISGSVALPPRENQSSHMSTPEDSLVLDDDKHDSKDASGSLSKKRDKLELRILKNNTAISETEISEKYLMSLSKSVPGSNSILFREADTKASGRPADAEKDTGFKFPVTNCPSSSKPPPNPNMHMSSLGRSDLQKEQTVTPEFRFGSKAACSFAFSSAASVGDTAVQNVGASDANMATSVEGSNIGKDGEMPKAGFLFKSFGKAVSSGIPTTASALFGFGSSTTPSQSNGSLHLSSLTSPVSAAHTVTHCDSQLSSTFATSTVTSTSMSSPFSSSSAPLFSTVTSFQFGSSTSMGAPSVTHLVNKSVSPNLEKKPVKAATFSTSSSSAPCTSSFSITGSSSSSTLTTSAFSHSDGSSSSLATSAAFPASLATSASFPSTGNSSLAPSSTFSNTGRSIFGFSAPAHSSTSSFSFASNSSQNFTTTSGASAGSVFRTQPTQSGSVSSQFAQSSTSQFDSLSSAPICGLIKPSSAGFGGSPFGFATLGGSSLSGGSVSSSPGTSSSFVPSATTTSLFSPGSQPCTSSAFGFTSGSTTSPSTGISFGLSSSASGSSTFSSSTGTAFSFTSVGSTTSSAFSTARPVFGVPTPTVGFSSGSPRNDQMNIEDSMTDDTNQSPVTMVSTFGQSANSSAGPNSAFGSAAVPSGGPPAFQFVGHQNPTPQSSLPFQAGNLVPPGGGFSVGSGGGDKSGRKFIKVKRDKLRKR